MTKEEIIEFVAERFGIQHDEDDGKYHLRDGDWKTGCYVNGEWLCPATVVSLIAEAMGIN